MHHRHKRNIMIPTVSRTRRLNFSWQAQGSGQQSKADEIRQQTPWHIRRHVEHDDLAAERSPAKTAKGWEKQIAKTTAASVQAAGRDDIVSAQRLDKVVSISAICVSHPFGVFGAELLRPQDSHVQRAFVYAMALFGRISSAFVVSLLEHCHENSGALVRLLFGSYVFFVDGAYPRVLAARDRFHDHCHPKCHSQAELDSCGTR